jgi:hypothetical protein
VSLSPCSTRDLSIARAGVVFVEDLEHEEAELITDQDRVVGTNITISASTVDASLPPSRKWESLITRPMQEFEGIKDARVLDSICRVFTTNFSGDASCEWRPGQFNEDLGLLVPVHDIATASQMRFRLALSDDSVRVYLVGYIFCIIDYHICWDVFGRIDIMYCSLSYVSRAVLSLKTPAPLYICTSIK